jgi:hypothetical protein
MRKRWYGVVAATMGGVVLAALPASPAAAGWNVGAGLKTGDHICSPQMKTTSGRLYGSITNGSGTATIRVASSVGGPETIVFSQTGTNLSVNKTVTAPPGSFMRGCIEITAHTVNTWTKTALFAHDTLWQSGPFEAISLSPGARYCGDSGIGAVRLLGNANAPVTWALNGLDNDYLFVGTVFSVTGSSVDTTYTSAPELADLEMCVINTSSQTVRATFDLVMV